MKKQVFKKITSSLALLALAVGVNTASANTISIVESASNAIAIADLAAGDTFSMDVNVVLDTFADPAPHRQYMGGSVTNINWAGNLSLNSFQAVAVDNGSSGMISANTMQIARVNLFSDSTLTGAFTWATLNFTYTAGPLSFFLETDPLKGAVSNGLSWTQPGGEAIVFTTTNNFPAAVPLPPAFLLLGSALLGLGFTGRRKAVAA